MLFESYLINGLHICGGQKNNHQEDKHQAQTEMQTGEQEKQQGSR